MTATLSGRLVLAWVFNTTQAQVLVNKHDGTALAARSRFVQGGYYRGIGNTNGSGNSINRLVAV